MSALIPKNNLYYRLQQVLDLDFLYELTKNFYGHCGQKSLDPVVFFKLCLIKHLENIDADRKLLQVCRLRLDLLYFLGYHLDEPLPWHSALCRTRKLFPKQLFEVVFELILSLCVKAGMVAAEVQVIDSALLKANASMDTLELKVPEELLQQTLEKVRVMSRADRKVKHNKASLEQQTLSAPRQHLQEIKSRNKRWKQEQDQRPGAQCASSKYTSNKTHYSPVDPHARIAVKPGKPRQLCYLQQLAVDGAHHVITYTQANHADKKDSQCLLQVVQGLLRQLKQQQLCCQCIAADAGYSSGENYHWLREQQLEGYIPLHGQFQGAPAGFSYQQEGNYWLCPYGKQVSFKKIVYDRYGNPQAQYMAKRADCKDCPIKAACMGKSKEKRIQLTYYWQEYEKARERVQSRPGRRMKRIRQSRVEPVFGTLINYMGLRRINTRGIVEAEKTMLMAASAYNLKKWLSFVPQKRKTAAMVIEKEPFNSLYAISNPLNNKGSFLK